jgi:hypothetical protein
MWTSVIRLFIDPNGEFIYDGSGEVHGLQVGTRVRREVVEFCCHMRKREAVAIDKRLIHIYGEKWRTPFRRIPLGIRQCMSNAEIGVAMHANDPMRYPTS